MFNYEEKEVLGRNCRFLQTKNKDQKSINDIRNAIKEKKPITIRVVNLKKNGELIHCELSISPIFDEKKELQYFLGIQKDVTR